VSGLRTSQKRQNHHSQLHQSPQNTVAVNKTHPSEARNFVNGALSIQAPGPAKYLFKQDRVAASAIFGSPKTGPNENGGNALTQRHPDASGRFTASQRASLAGC
jgi:hypothetical protein